MIADSHVLSAVSPNRLLAPLNVTESADARAARPAFAAEPGAAKAGRWCGRRPREDGRCGAAVLLSGANVNKRFAGLVGRDAQGQATSEAKANIKRYVEEVMRQAAKCGQGQPYLPTGADNAALYHRGAAWQGLRDAATARGDAANVSARYQTLLRETLAQVVPWYGKKVAIDVFEQRFSDVALYAYSDDTALFESAIGNYSRRARARL